MWPKDHSPCTLGDVRNGLASFRKPTGRTSRRKVIRSMTCSGLRFLSDSVFEGSRTYQPWMNGCRFGLVQTAIWICGLASANGTKCFSRYCLRTAAVAEGAEGEPTHLANMWETARTSRQHCCRRPRNSGSSVIGAATLHDSSSEGPTFVHNFLLAVPTHATGRCAKTPLQMKAAIYTCETTP